MTFFSNPTQVLELSLKAYHDGIASTACRKDPQRFGQLLTNVYIGN
jgi:hypothetical protein